MGPQTEDVHYIRISNGQMMRVDARDWTDLSRFKWTATCGANKKQIYAMRNIQRHGKIVRLKIHRHIMNASEVQQVDHINGNTLDNRRSNLRFCNPRQNTWNSGIRVDNKTGFKGVQWLARRSRWVAKIKLPCGTLKQLGSFKEAHLAGAAYARAAAELHGEFYRESAGVPSQF